MGYLAINNLREFHVASDYLMLLSDKNSVFRQIDFKGALTLSNNFQGESLPKKYTAK